MADAGRSSFQPHKTVAPYVFKYCAGSPVEVYDDATWL
jgi:hypothetical protein